MSFIKKNIWAIGFGVIIIGALLAMALASRNVHVPAANSTAENKVDFQISAYDNVRGPATAKVTMVEFGDFQCPACGAYYPLVEQLSKEFPNDLRVVFRNFPLTTIHMQALNAAHVAAAAALQGKFWEMYSALYPTQSTWSVLSGLTPFDTYAQQIGLDMTKFHADVNSDVVKTKINNDIDNANSIGINSTPTFYVNGIKIINPQSYADFKAVITAAIASSTVAVPVLTQ